MVDFIIYEYGIGLIFLNSAIYIYLLTIVFLVFFLFDLRFFKSLNELRGFFNLPFISFTVVLCFLSLAGMPPMLGFLGKLLMVIFFLFKSTYFILCLFLILNFFAIYFYIINLRFLVTKYISFYFFIKNFNVYLNFKIIYILVVLNVFNLFGIFFFDDFLIFISHFFF